MPLGTLHLAVEKFLWQAACYQTVHVSHFGHEAVDITLCLKFAADYADIYEVRGQHGQHAAATWSPNSPAIRSSSVTTGSTTSSGALSCDSSRPPDPDAPRGLLDPHSLAGRGASSPSSAVTPTRCPAIATSDWRAMKPPSSMAGRKLGCAG